MAAGGPVQELCQEATCPICLEFFRDPVSIAECGHSFCRACLTRGFGEPGPAEPSCPQCRGRAQEGSLRPNLQLANFVEIIQKLRPLEARGGGAGAGGVYEEPREPLKFLCEEDEAPLCVVCSRSRKHRDHQAAPLEEEAKAAGKKKDQFCTCVEILRKERNKFIAYKARIVKESQDLLRQTEAERQKTLTKFRQLQKFLEEEEKLLLDQMEEVEKEVARKRDQHLAKLSEELSSLESLLREMEEKNQQPASDLLQDARRTLQRYAAFESPEAFPLALKWRIWDFSDLNLLLESIEKQVKDTLDYGRHLQKASVTLDPDTAHPQLILSEGQKSVRDGEKVKVLLTSPERFDQCCIVLGREGFRAGRHFWEVLVGSEEEWLVGVARKSVRRKGGITLNPEEGFWAVGKWSGGFKAIVKSRPLLSLTGELKRIRVCLNYAGGRVAFFDADRAALLYEFSEASFHGEILLPFFLVYKKGHLKISS